MNREEMKHNDCLKFAPIDAAKGICRETNEIVFIDTPTCGDFSLAPKCKNCASFKNVDKDNIGTCTGLKKEAWVYGELNAVTCEGYKKLCQK